MMAAAVLIWLPRGEAIESFGPGQIEPPPRPNPKWSWLLSDAIVHAP